MRLRKENRVIVKKEKGAKWVGQTKIERGANWEVQREY